MTLIWCSLFVFTILVIGKGYMFWSCEVGPFKRQLFSQGIVYFSKITCWKPIFSIDLYFTFIQNHVFVSGSFFLLHLSCCLHFPLEKTGWKAFGVWVFLTPARDSESKVVEEKKKVVLLSAPISLLCSLPTHCLGHSKQTAAESASLSWSFACQDSPFSSSA